MLLEFISLELALLLETIRLISLEAVDAMEEGEGLVSKGSLLRKEEEAVLIVFAEVDGKGISQATKSIGSKMKKTVFEDDFIKIF